MQKEELASLPHGIQGLAIYQEQNFVVFWLFTICVLMAMLAVYFFIFQKYSNIKALPIDKIGCAKKIIEEIQDFSLQSSVKTLVLEFRRIIFLKTQVPSLELTSEQLIPELEHYFHQNDIVKLTEFFRWSERVLFSDVALNPIEVQTWKREILMWVDYLLSTHEEQN